MELRELAAPPALRLRQPVGQGARGEQREQRGHRQRRAPDAPQRQDVGGRDAERGDRRSPVAARDRVQRAVGREPQEHAGGLVRRQRA